MRRLTNAVLGSVSLAAALAGPLACSGNGSSANRDGGGAGGGSASGGTGGRAGSTGAGGGGRGGSSATGGSTGAGGSGSGSGGALGGFDGGPASMAKGPLRVDSTNPRYFNDGAGHVVFLVGSHTWGNFKDRDVNDPPPAFDYAKYLDFLQAHNHNFFRLWTWEQPHSQVGGGEQGLRYLTPFAWPRTGPGNASDGKPKFDLSQFDDGYFARLRARVVDAGARGIYVSVMLFDGYDMVNVYNDASGGFPYGSGNNVNGIAVTGPQAVTLSNAAATAIQEAYVRKVVDTVNDLDNVLYEIANEPDTTGVNWEYHFIDLVKTYEAGKPKQHPVGMTSTSPGTDSALTSSSADWISPNTRLFSASGSKVVLNDTDHAYYWSELRGDGVPAQRAWAWETIALGAQPLFMDPYLEARAGRNSPSGGNVDPYWEPLRYALGYTRSYADRMDLAHAVPSASLSSTGYCLANPGTQYLVYQPSSGAFMVNVMAGTYTAEWFNPSTGTVAQSGSMTLAAGNRSFTPPFSGDAVLFLYR